VVQEYEVVRNLSKEMEIELRKSILAKNKVRKNFENRLKDIKVWVEKSSTIAESHRTALKLSPLNKVRASYRSIINSRPVVAVDFSERLQHTLMICDENSPGIFQKVAGSIGAEIWIKKGGIAPAGVKDCTFHSVTGRGRQTIRFPESEAGLMVHYLVRWIGKDSNVTAPFSELVSCVLVG
jgi:hypothetical protein